MCLMKWYAAKQNKKMTVHINPKVVKVKEIKIEMKFQDFL